MARHRSLLLAMLLCGAAGAVPACLAATGTDRLAILAPFSRVHQLAAKYPAIDEVKVTGLGGTMWNTVVRTHALQIGPVTLSQLPTTLAADLHGVAASLWTAGNIGGAVLRNFTVTLDYPHRMMYLEPNGYAPAAN